MTSTGSYCCLVRADAAIVTSQMQERREINCLLDGSVDALWRNIWRPVAATQVQLVLLLVSKEH